MGIQLHIHDCPVPSVSGGEKEMKGYYPMVSLNDKNGIVS